MRLLCHLLVIFTSFLCDKYAYCQQWELLGNGVSGPVHSMYADHDNDFLYLTGRFHWLMTETDTITVTAMAIWDGNNWLTLPEADITCQGFLCNPVGTVVHYNDVMLFTGMFSDGQFMKMLANSEWQNFGEPNDLAGLRLVGDELFALGLFTEIGGQYISNRIAQYDGANWHQFASELEGFTSITSFSQIVKYQGNYYVGGNFKNPDGRNNIMYWDGIAWHPLGQGLLGGISWVNSMHVYNDLLYVSGYFTQENGNAGNFIMAWNGEEWLDVFPQLNFFAAAGMLVHDNVLYITGLYLAEDPCCVYTIGTYDGAQFCTFGGYMPFPPQAPNSYPHQIAILHDKVYVRVGITFFGESFNYLARIDKDTPSDYCTDIVPLTAISENSSLGNMLTIHPNPTSSYLTLTGSALLPGSELKVYNVAGQQVYSEVLPYAHETHTLDARRFGPAGLYLLHLNSPGHTPVVKKVVVQG